MAWCGKAWRCTAKEAISMVRNGAAKERRDNDTRRNGTERQNVDRSRTAKAWLRVAMNRWAQQRKGVDKICLEPRRLGKEPTRGTENCYAKEWLRDESLCVEKLWI
ncbi:MAG: hypothetical protein LIR46_12930 [Bacteroidota bacterium]|nr:hypothetical protein [Bacteroidota bacterium]